MGQKIRITIQNIAIFVNHFTPLFLAIFLTICIGYYRLLASMAINQIIRVSISEAAKLFGVNAQTIRRAIKSEDLSYVIVQGRYKISFESLLKWSERHVTIGNKMESKGIGQYVEQWKIRNKSYSPNPQIVQAEPEPGENLSLFAIRPPDRIESKSAPAPKPASKSSPQQSSVLPL